MIGWIAGCTPLTQVVREDAPGFDVKRPASSDDNLGARIINQQPDTNRCFKGVPSNKPFASWSGRTLNYSAGGGGKLQGDFGGTVNVGVGASGKRTINITLKDMALTRLDGLYFDPKGACATDPALRARYMQPEGVIDRVVTQVLGAGTIEIEDVKEGSAQVDASVSKVPVKVTAEANGRSRSTWQGTKLFIAHYLERFKVTYLGATGCDQLAVGTGQTCDLGACSLKMDAASDDDYKGSLSCQDGSSFPLQQKFGAWDGQQTASGVSYSVRCRKLEKAGLFGCDLFRWNVLTQ